MNNGAGRRTGGAPRRSAATDAILFTPMGGAVKAKTPGQGRLVEAARMADIVFAVGPAGTGKTYVSVALAVSALMSRQVKKIVLARPAVEALLATHNWLVLTGAVSMGARDFVPTLLDDLGCRKVFHGVAHRPGKPAGCWVGPAGQVILALPGNPVSALTGLHVFLIPALAAAAGAAVGGGRRGVMDDLSLQLADFTYHLPVTLGADGRATATTAGNSGDFIGLLRSEGFVTLPPRGAPDRAFPFTPWL